MLESAGILLDKIVRKYADIFVCVVYPLNKTIWYNEIYQLFLSVGVRIGRCSLWSVGNALFLFAYLYHHNIIINPLKDKKLLKDEQNIT